MIDKQKFDNLYSLYLEYFKNHRSEKGETYWEQEEFKWRGVKNFQDNWDIDAPDLADMIKRSLSVVSFMMSSRSYFPEGMIEGFAQKEPDTVRDMFRYLYDESKDVVDRFRYFKEKSDDLLKRYGDKSKKENNHFQDERTIAMYLWLKYPDKYYIYRFNQAKNLSIALGSDHKFIRRHFAQNTRDWLALYDEVTELIKDKPEIRKLEIQGITDKHYVDSAYHMLTLDMAYWYNDRYLKEQKERDSADTEDGQNTVQSDISGKYDKQSFLNEVFMDSAKYDEINAVLKRKKNVILQGAPGAGKTFAAKRLAYSIIGSQDDTYVRFVQFHQNYSYEDFIEGYKPCNKGFQLESGVFKTFCDDASVDPNKPYFFIIDEINRGNLSKIFGELLMLIEKGYRGHAVSLASSHSQFSVPENVYIIGMMNTADRSLAMIDYALRRRFSFVDMEPGFDTDGFKNYAAGKNSNTFNALVNTIKQLNEAITADSTLGKGFCIGHSYFVFDEPCTDRLLRSIVHYDILPMLREYWFDNDSEYDKWEKALKEVVHNDQ